MEKKKHESIFALYCSEFEKEKYFGQDSCFAHLSLDCTLLLLFAALIYQLVTVINRRCENSLPRSAVQSVHKCLSSSKRLVLLVLFSCSIVQFGLCCLTSSSSSSLFHRILPLLTWLLYLALLMEIQYKNLQFTEGTFIHILCTVAGVVAVPNAQFAFALIFRQKQTTAIAIVNVVSLSLTAVFGMLSFVYCFYGPKNMHQNSHLMSRRTPSPFDNNSLLSLLSFGWMTPYITIGLNRRLEMKDIPPLPMRDETQLSASFFKLAYQKELQAVEPSFLRLLCALYIREIFVFGLWSAFNKLIGLLGPLLIREFLKWSESIDNNSSDGYIIAGAMIFQAVMSSVSGSQYGLAWQRFDLRLRAGLLSTIYERTLTLDKRMINKFGIGYITNLMSVDLGRLIGMPGNIFDIILIPTEIAVALYLLNREVSYAFTAGLIVLAVMLPIQTLLGNQIQIITTKMLQFRDERVQNIAEALDGMKVLKLLSWVEFFLARIGLIRGNEMGYLGKRKYLDAFCVFFWASTPVLVQTSVFVSVVYFTSQQELTAANAFTAVALLDRLIFPMNYFPWLLNGFLEARVSALRIRAFLFQHIHSNPPFLLTKKKSTDNVLVKMENQTFSWQFEEEKKAELEEALLPEDSNAFELTIDSLQIKKGELIVISGPIGSGKSSFLSALLGEMYSLNTTYKFTNSISYAPQSPWIFPGSIRQNITCGKVLRKKKFLKIFRLCGLDQDFGKNYDKIICSKTLSGGQKQRISLARALYDDQKELLLLDDVLSSIDTETGRHIMQNLHEFVNEKCSLILVTHSMCLLQYLPAGTRYFHMQEGRMHETKGSDQQSEQSNVKDKIDAQIHKEEQHEEREEEKREIGVVKKEVWVKYMRSIGCCLCLMLFFSVVLMQVSRNGIDFWLAYYTSHRDMISKYHFAHVLLSITGVNIIAALLRSFLFAYGGLKAAKSIYKLFIERVFHAPWKFFTITPVGRILNRFSGDTYMVDESLPFQLNIFIKDVFDLIGSLTLLFYGNGPSFLFFIVPLVFVYYKLQNYYRPTSRHLGRLNSTVQSPLYTLLTETLHGNSVIQAMQMQSVLMRSFLFHLNRSQKTGFLNCTAGCWFGIRLDCLGVSITAFISVVAVYNNQSSVLNPGMLGLLLIYALPIVGKFNAILGSFIATEKEMISVERIQEYSLLDDEDNGVGIIVDLSDSKGEVQFSNLSVKYRLDSDVYALRNLNCTVKSGEKIGICGRTGAGKSSLFLALFRMIPYLGSIRIDQQDVRSLSIACLREKLACIPQDPVFFQGSIRFNLNPMFEGETNDEDYWDVLRKCCLDGIVRSLPLGLDTQLKNDEAVFSCGQRQLFCLGRALFKKEKAAIVAIDEATSSVDPSTDGKIQQILRSEFQHQTVLTVAHRIQTIKDCDRVLVLEKGQLIECDNPQTLLQNPNSKFAALAKEL